jgi:O-antigen/teichoic acid export membrane protein
MHWVFTFGVTGLNAALMFGVSVALARSLGPDGRGALVAVMVWPALLLSLFLFSINEATAYQVARARAAGENPERWIRSALTLSLVLAGLATLASLLILPWVLTGERATLLPMAMMYTAVLTPVVILDLYYIAIRQGLGDLANANWLRLCQPMIYAAVVLLLVLATRLQLESVLAANILSVLGSLAVGLSMAGATWPTYNRADLQTLFGTGLRIHGLNTLLYLAAEADKLVVLYVLEPASAGIYVVALAVSTMGSSLVIPSLGAVAYPLIAAARERPDQVALICRFTQAATWLLLLINGATAAVLWWLIPTIFGQAFAPAVSIALILLAMNVFRGIRLVLDRAQRATLTTRFAIQAEAVGLITFVLCGPLAAKHYGLTGLAWAMAFAQLLALATIVGGAARHYCVSPVELLGLTPSIAAALVKSALQEITATRKRMFQ